MMKKRQKVLLKCARTVNVIVGKSMIGMNAVTRLALDSGLHTYILNGVMDMRGKVGMSIQVNDFQWEPGKNDAEYIKLLESSRDEWQKLAQKAIAKLKALSKSQKPRVMTWEEAQANVQNGPFVIFEVRDSTGSEVDFGVEVTIYNGDNSIICYQEREDFDKCRRRGDGAIPLGWMREWMRGQERQKATAVGGMIADWRMKGDGKA